jgi:hypothetical protein
METLKEELIKLLPAIIGSLITLCCTITVSLINIYSDSQKDNKNYSRKVKENHFSEIRAYFKLFLQYFNTVTNVYSNFKLYLDDKITYEILDSSIMELGKIDIQEIFLLQEIYFNNDTTKQIQNSSWKINNYLSNWTINNIKSNNQIRSYNDAFELFFNSCQKHRMEIKNYLKKYI